METHLCQRWRDKRGTYRLAREPFDPRAYDVTELSGDALPKAFIERHHYAGSYPAARFRFGLVERASSELAGVAVFSQPMRKEVLRPFDADEAAELGRLVLLDHVQANAESWFVARAFDALRGRLEAVVSFSDPTPRTTAAGEALFAGHIGTVYQALNAVYTGRSKARILRLLPDGRVFSERAMSKIRQREQGWRYAVEQLVEAGAAPPQGDLGLWLPRALAAVTRPLRHGGNHRYLWSLKPANHKRLRSTSAPYPKFTTLQGTTL